VREERLLEESLVEDEACEAQHGNATNSHLKLRQEQQQTQPGLSRSGGCDDKL
jgi:hypothetical protein